ncbi:MAG: cysteine--tRNA ligase [Leptospiraceae bacterium]|nr:cysteine--tRNA ligase [Leptospiraceae bacterium]
MALTLYNTETRKKEQFVPFNRENVTMYVCGPTVYSYAHIGNARAAVVFDLLFRVLQLNYKKITYVRNFTDIDDKINKAASEQNVPISEITRHFANIYQKDMLSLGNLAPTLEPKVTEHIPQIIKIISELIEKGHAYEAEGHVLFNVPSYPEYGSLSHRDRDDQIAGARVETAPFKKDAADFVLWKPSDDSLPGWASPWGRGRPGWHIECTAMSREHLGENFDIHGGGQDLIFPHHENELAQGKCSGNHGQYAKYWVHNGFVKVNGSKMSKSLGNVFLVHDLLEKYPGEVLRYCLLSSHYRQPLDWTDDLTSQGQEVLDKFYRTYLELQQEFDLARHSSLDKAQPTQEIVDALNDDLNMSKVFAVLHRLIAEIRKQEDPEIKKNLGVSFIASARIIGLMNFDPEQWFQKEKATSIKIDELYIENLIQERKTARSEKNFKRADEIRDELKSNHIVLEDKPDGTTEWKIFEQ